MIAISTFPMIFFFLVNLKFYILSLQHYFYYIILKFYAVSEKLLFLYMVKLLCIFMRFLLIVKDVFCFGHLEFATRCCGLYIESKRVTVVMQVVIPIVMGNPHCQND